jgi:predicted NBD/HSP70 family sugar kinase
VASTIGERGEDWDVHSERKSPIGTRAIVLRLIRAYGTISRVELAAATGLTVAAMTTIVRRLLSEGLVEEAGNSGFTGGKPRTLLRLRRDAGYGIGVSVDLNLTRLVLVDFAGLVVGTLPPVESSRAVEQLSSTIVAGTHELAAQYGVTPDSILGLAVAGPGPHDRAVLEKAPAPYLDRWLDASLSSAIEGQLGIPVLLLNDANAVAAGEFGLSLDARSSGNFACVYMGESGLGSGIFADGQLVLGSNSFAGAIAHVSIDVEGPICLCGASGCLELYASPHAIIETIRESDKLMKSHPVGVSKAGAVTSSDMDLIYTAVRAGHPYVTGHINKVAQYIASAAATMATLFDLDLIVLAGGGFVGAEATYANALEDFSARIKRAGARRSFAVRQSALAPGNYAAAVGGALSVLETFAEVRGRGVSPDDSVLGRANT